MYCVDYLGLVKHVHVLFYNYLSHHLKQFTSNLIPCNNMLKIAEKTLAFRKQINQNIAYKVVPFFTVLPFFIVL